MSRRYFVVDGEKLLEPGRVLGPGLGKDVELIGASGGRFLVSVTDDDLGQSAAVGALKSIMQRDCSVAKTWHFQLVCVATRVGVDGKMAHHVATEFMRLAFGVNTSGYTGEDHPEDECGEAGSSGSERGDA